MVFIKILDELRSHIDLKKIGIAIVNDINETKIAKTRFTCRFIPVDLLCKAGKFEEFKLMAEPIIHKYFP